MEVCYKKWKKKFLHKKKSEKLNSFEGLDAKILIEPLYHLLYRILSGEVRFRWSEGLSIRLGFYNEVFRRDAEYVTHVHCQGQIETLDFELP
jgi:hypothetical protein